MPHPVPQDFDDLARLLALKRHEQPPPGFFECFSSRVMAHVEAGQEFASEPWWRPWWLGFQAKPVLASAYCLLAAGVSLFALSMIELATGPAEDEAPLAMAVWPQLNSRAAADLTGGMAFDRFSNPLNPLFSEGMISDGNSAPPRFLLEGTGWKAQPVNVRY